MKDFLTHKGWIATMLGAFLGFPVEAIMIVKYLWGPSFTNQELITSASLLGLAMLMIILPSTIEFTSKFFNLKVED